MQKLKIAYISTYNAENINNWSGTGYYIAKTLEKYLGEITFIGNLDSKKYIRHDIKRVRYKITGRVYDPTRSKLMGKRYARKIEEQLKGKNYDLIFSPGTIPVAYLESKIPVVFWTDSNFHGMIDYYLRNLCYETIMDGNLIEKMALEKSALAIYSSDWAANGAVDFYKINPNKVKVVPFGANISNVSSENELKHKLNEEIKLLFVGKDWKRKGGNKAFETMKELNKRGIDTNLTIVGCIPPKPYNDEKLVVIPFLDKNKNEDSRVLRKLYLESDFFIVPSRLECYGIVFCEAAAFGLPVLSSITGGIQTIVKDGINGYLLPLESDGSEFANKIIEIKENRNYEQLCISSRQRYNEVLNWDVAGKKLKQLIESIV